MIDLQRKLLKRTFALRETKSVALSRIEALAETQQDIRTATEEFATGIQQRGGDVPALFDAITDMQAATTALVGLLVERGQEMEESALANLIRARQNLRNFLKQSDSQQAAQCRSFDRQQQQKLRMPEKEQKPEDQRTSNLLRRVSK